MIDDTETDKKHTTDLLESFPGYPEKFDSITENSLNPQTMRMLDAIIRLGMEKDSFLFALKGAYVLGALNEENGVHATKQ